MREERTPRVSLTAIAALGFIAMIVVAGCGGGGGTVTAVTATGTTATGTTATPAAGALCAQGTGGVAYLSDGGASGLGAGLWIVPFESTTQAASSLCSVMHLTTPSGTSLSDFSISLAGDGVAIERQGNGPTTTIQGIAGLSSGQSPFFAGQSQPTVATANALPVTSLALLSGGTIGLAVGPDTSAQAGFVGINNILGFAPTPTPIPSTTPAASPTPSATPDPFATATPADTPVPNPAMVPYASIGATTAAPNTLLNGATRESVALAPDGATLLVRGGDLATFEVSTTAAGFELSYPAESSATPPLKTLGSGENPNLGLPSTASAGTYGHGLIAFSPAGGGRAIIGGTQTNPNAVTVISGMPTTVTQLGATLSLPAQVTSVAYDGNGSYGIAGTTNGVYMIGGVGAGAPTQTTKSANAQLTYTSSLTGTQPIGRVISVGFSADTKYALALVADTPSGQSPALASLLVFTITPTGDLGAIVATYNNLPAANGDYMIVR